MVSSKIVILAIVLLPAAFEPIRLRITILAIVMFACIMHTQAASSEDEDKNTDGGFSLSNLEAIKNFNKLFSKISKDPTQTFSILSSSIKGKAKGASKNKGSDKEDD